MPDFARWTVAFEMLVLIGALAAIIALDDHTRRRAPRAWWWATAAIALVLGGATVAVVVNALIAGPQTPGVKLLVYIAGPAATLALVGVVKALRRPRSDVEVRAAHIAANADALAVTLTHVGHLEPCPNPDCQRIRTELRQLAGHPAPRSADTDQTPT